MIKLSSNNGRRRRRKRKRRIKTHQLQQQKEDDDVVVDNNDFFDFILSSSSSSDDQSISSLAAVDYQADNNGDIDNASINPSPEIDNRIMSTRIMPSSMAMTATDDVNDNGDSKEGLIASIELEDTAIIASSTLISQMEDAMFTDIFKHGEVNDNV